AKTVELAVQEALQRLQVGRERVDVVVREAPSRGFLGIGAKLAQVDVSIVEDPVGDAERFLRELFVTMRLAVKVTTEVSRDQVVFDLSGDRVGLLIGKHGQTLDAIQHLVTAVGNKHASRGV
ncbi:MAG: KH domain-containing protein, partial [Firmicutes bacterium]|nr:KH domain-containing protein [Bacillota bacterium]